jgi:hypothetical protein
MILIRTFFLDLLFSHSKSDKKSLLFGMDGYGVAGDGTTIQLQAMLTGLNFIC